MSRAAQVSSLADSLSEELPARPEFSQWGDGGPFAGKKYFTMAQHASWVEYLTKLAKEKGLWPSFGRSISRMNRPDAALDIEKRIKEQD